MMNVEILTTNKEMGEKAALEAAQKIKQAIREKGTATMILATGASQFEVLNHLTQDTTIDWSKVRMFHLDEYVGMPATHPASFRNYLKERFVEKVPALKAVYFIEGDTTDLNEECERLGQLIAAHPVDVALVGIGENGHLAFNDPPADFTTEAPYLVVVLDEPCRRQQMGEGWFDTLESVPEKAISMSIRQIMKSKHIVCSVPDQRKAEAVKDCLEGKVSHLHPASILQEHPACTLYLDAESASLLSTKP